LLSNPSIHALLAAGDDAGVVELPSPYPVSCFNGTDRHTVMCGNLLELRISILEYDKNSDLQSQKSQIYRSYYYYGVLGLYNFERKIIVNLSFWVFG
jgi:hypothetical protein